MEKMVVCGILFHLYIPTLHVGDCSDCGQLWHCVDLQVDMSIPEEPAAFAFRVEGLGTSLSLLQAYMVSQLI